MSTALIVCPSCGSKNRITLGPHKSRCGKCKRIFTPADLVKAELEQRPITHTPLPDDDEPEDEEEPEYECRTCGWSGSESDCEEDDRGKLCCPDCTRKVRKIEEDE